MIWNFCITRPVLTIVLFVALGIFGGYSFRQLPIRENPDVEFPIVSVNVVLPGAEPEVIETEIIEPLEERINTVEGIKTLTSTAREQVGTVTAEFELWRDIDIATQDVRDRVDRARRELPEAIEAPIIRQVDPDARAIIWISLRGDRRWDTVRMTRYADEVLKEQLENLEGVGRIQIGGERLYAARVRLDPDRLAAHRVTVQDVVRTIQANNVKIPSGRIESIEREFLVKTEGQFASPEPMNELIITERNGAPIRIRDVGEVVEGVENDRQLARFAGEPAVGLGVVKQPDANTVALSNEVMRRIESLAENFPPGLEYTIATDDSKYVEQSIRDLIITIGIAACLVLVVILFFLHTLRGTFIAGLAMPISLLGGLLIANALDFSLNTLTLLALILAIGIVIDDAIVVLESTFRHMEQGDEARNAARVGTSEVAFPSIANTLALAAVFIPVAFTAGLIGRFFFEFSLTVAATVFASTLTALTLTPMLCSRMLRVKEKPGLLHRWAEGFLRWLDRFYNWWLVRAFRFRTLTLIIGLLMFGLGIYFFTQLPREFIPVVDRAEFLIRFETPEGSTLGHTDEYAREIEAVLEEMAEIRHQFLAIGLSQGGGPGRVNEGIAFVKLTPRGERERHQTEIAQNLRQRLARLPGGQAYVIQITTGGPSQGSPLQMVLQHQDLDELARVQAEVMDWMRQQPDYLGVRSNLKMNKPQVEVTILRDKASQMGISVTDIANTMRFLLGEPDISEIERGNERYEVIPEVYGKGRMTPDDLKSFYIRSASGELVALENVARVEETIGPSEIHHFNRLRSATIQASTPPDVVLGEALSKLEGHLEEVLPGGFQTTVTGQAQEFRESFRYLTIALVFSIVFIYLVLAGQFESFIHPFTILMALPLAAVGAFGVLWALGMTFSIYAFVGIIMLTGMATKNAILLIDYTNVLRRRGMDRIEAAMEAARVRFRPVVMTTVSTVLGMMPIAFGFGAGGEARAPLGAAVAAGLTTTTVLTLLVVPVLYTLIDQLQERIVGKREQRSESASGVKEAKS